MTRLGFDESDFEDFLSFMEGSAERIEGLAGLRFAELAKTGEGEGMIIAAYEDEDGYGAVSGDVQALLEEMSRFLTSTPHGHEGTVVVSFGEAP